jgi:acyl-coenzyme A thioesterase 9
MKDTRQQSIQFSFPQDRNMHQNIFGGWLMKQAYELAFATGILFCRTRPQFLLLEEVIFKKPVPIGSLIYFTAQVVYTDANVFQVKVQVMLVLVYLINRPMS